LETAIALVAHKSGLPGFDRRACGELVYYGGGMTADRVANYIALQGDNMVVGRWLGASALGFYGRAYQLLAAPADLLGQVLDTVLFPAIAAVQNEQRRLATAYRLGATLIALLTLPISMAMFVLAPELVHVLLGPSWKEVTLPFQILALGLLFRTGYKISDSLVRATGAVYSGAWRQGVYAALVLMGAWVGQHWGISGVALAVVGAIMVKFILMAQLSLRLTSMSWRTYLTAHLRPLLLAAAVFVELSVVATLMRQWGLGPILVLLVAGLVVLLTMALLLRLTPWLLLAEDGQWMWQTLMPFIPQRLTVLRMFRKRPQQDPGGETRLR
jgi:PST family polysaccharide transporter